MQTPLILVILLLATLFLTACGGGALPPTGEATGQIVLAAAQTASPSNTPPSPTNTLIPPTATPEPPPPTNTPTLTPSPAPPTATPLPVTGQVEGELSPKAAGVKVTLCDDWVIGLERECKGFEQSVTVEPTGQFLFSAIPPGDYFIIFDIPMKQRSVIASLPCKPGELGFCDKEPVEGIRQCFCTETLSYWREASLEPIGGTVVVEAGKTTNVNRAEIIFPKSVPQPELTGPINAAGKAEVSIVNDSPFTLTVHLTGPASQSLEVPGCAIAKQQDCKVKIKGREPKTCQTEGRPQVTVQIPAGTYEVEERGENFSITGQWILQKDSRYQNCYFMVGR